MAKSIPVYDNFRHIKKIVKDSSKDISNDAWNQLNVELKNVIFFKDLLENIRKRKVYAFNFLQIQKAKNKFRSQN